MTVFLYQKLSPLVSINALSAFFLATGLILLTLIPVIFLYQRLINKKPSVAAFTYCQFVIAAEILSLLANQTWQWDFFTIILTLCLYFLLKKEIRYISQEQTKQQASKQDKQQNPLHQPGADRHHGRQPLLLVHHTLHDPGRSPVRISPHVP